mmetsp:Transcript_12968/g.28429  ORF Transcript_12968/g.28429 Transcript_12968/m.28429 type:complete len:211 (-) Transcript_12968:4450-5082(-)
MTHKQHNLWQLHFRGQEAGKCFPALRNKAGRCTKSSRCAVGWIHCIQILPPLSPLFCVIILPDASIETILAQIPTSKRRFCSSGVRTAAHRFLNKILRHLVFLSGIDVHTRGKAPNLQPSHIENVRLVSLFPVQGRALEGSGRGGSATHKIFVQSNGKSARFHILHGGWYVEAVVFIACAVVPPYRHCVVPTHLDKFDLALAHEHINFGL